MPKTKITAEFYLPTTSIARVQDALKEIVGVVEGHKGTVPFVTIQGPYSDKTSVEVIEHGEDSEDGSGSNFVGRGERGGAGDGGSAGGDADVRPAAARSDDDDSGAEQPKRGRGRPRKSAPEEGSSGGKPDGGKPSGSGAKGSERDEPKRTREVPDEGASEGSSRTRGADRGRDNQRRDSEAARVKDDDWGDDWADEGAEDDGDISEADAAKSSDPWPDSLTPDDIDKTVITTLLGEHYKATGGKDRAITFDLLEEITGHRQLGQVDEADYRDLAKALLKDTAKYVHGIKKAK